MESTESLVHVLRDDIIPRLNEIIRLLGGDPDTVATRKRLDRIRARRRQHTDDEVIQPHDLSEARDTDQSPVSHHHPKEE